METEELTLDLDDAGGQADPDPIVEKPDPTPVVEAPPWAALSQTLERIDKQSRDNAPQPQASQSNQLDPEKLRQINEKLATEIVGGNALGVIAPIAREMAMEQVNELRRQFEPYRDAAAEAFVERFRARKKEDDHPALYKQTVTEFEKALEDIDLKALAGQPKAAQNKTLDLYWKAARGEVLEKRVRKATEAPAGASAGGGRSMGPARQSDANKLGAEERRALAGYYKTKESFDAAVARVEAGMNA